jgi:antitoxin VapB
VQTAKLFMNGRSQAVRLPKGFRFEGEEVFVKKVGNAVVLLPRRDSWETLYESLSAFSEDFMEERGQPSREQERAEAPFD